MNFVRLLEKAQDNIGKRAAVEKESSTIQKDKEDQSKFYLSYPNPRVLDMKWENRDIIVAKRENIPEFSKVDDIVTPLRLLRLFFEDVIVKKQTLVLKLLLKMFAYS